MQIEDFPTLWGHIGKARADRIRNHTTDKMQVGSGRTRWYANPHQSWLAGFNHYTDNRALDDVLTGVCRAEQDGTKVALSPNRLMILLQLNKRVSTDLVKATMGLEERQARRYVAAAKLAIFFITRNDMAYDHIEEGLIDNPWTYGDRHEPEFAMDYL